jgi:hypothetical protein
MAGRQGFTEGSFSPVIDYSSVTLVLLFVSGRFERALFEYHEPTSTHLRPLEAGPTYLHSGR